MMQSKYTELPIIDYRGKPIKLAYHVTYTMRLKNGYILALKPGEHLMRIPNLLATQPKQKRA
ncbi:hypothetical protein FC83_GL002013 [Agrilactobacillus composti DSM 18527 = JCM 14202]|uniref:Uncharacterized protein n=1 Tax=Agrilactobacillus composti DSM 18527 = JCM 14202 TaxID=1423734 RepID=X0PML1_9LACO|nr:hypothetical protein FC83_GL002013 [Agrilactobacillus composti DSM 18527 = JCM 14202]GAF38747.1 hypothetical protein JCM14202_575 [Agrilactobacillus composti DSM 18527 = JCM 14202]